MSLLRGKEANVFATSVVIASRFGASIVHPINRNNYTSYYTANPYWPQTFRRRRPAGLRIIFELNSRVNGIGQLQQSKAGSVWEVQFPLDCLFHYISRTGRDRECIRSGTFILIIHLKNKRIDNLLLASNLINGEAGVFSIPRGEYKMLRIKSRWICILFDSRAIQRKYCNALRVVRRRSWKLLVSKGRATENEKMKLE